MRASPILIVSGVVLSVMPNHASGRSVNVEQFDKPLSGVSGGRLQLVHVK
jgi:hypothetical protein